MQQARINEIKTLKEPDQIKVSSKLNLKLPEVNHTPEAKREAMINLEGVAVTKMVQEIMKEEDQGTEMTDLSHKAGLIPRAKVVSDVERQIMSHKTVISRKRLV